MIASIQQLLFEVVAEILECEEEELSLSYRKEDNENWDSVNALRLFVGIESEFDIQLDMEKFLQVETIRDIVDMVEAAKK